MNQYMYQTYLGAKGVAFAWIGAAIGPSFFMIGLDPEYRTHLAIGIVCFVLVVASIFDGLKALKVKSWSGVIAFTVVPLVLLVVGVVFSTM
ncbi:MAG: hypothetical protein OIF51_01585 [Cellvibrionaceae bacterium]|nr:hypothetical protein [Cellvibrionaceae bacterium]